jgi:iron complex outermembrane receptor protein
VPVALHVLSGDALEKKGPINLANFTRESASVTAFSSNQRNTTISIRGLGTVSSAGSDGIDSGVGFYIDDVYLGRVSQSMLNLIDLERVEILRGPQGTLFGRNTTAGAISVITKAPSFEREGTFDLSIGNYNLIQARGTLSGTVIPGKLATRVSFGAMTRDGWLYNRDQLNYQHDLQNATARGQLLYTPNRRVRVRLIADYTKQATTCCQNVTIGYATKFTNGATIPRTFTQRAADLGYVPPRVDPGAREIDSDGQRSFRVGLGGVSLRADWDVSRSHTLSSISAYRFWNTSPRNDADGSALDVTVEGNGDDRQYQVSEELRLASTGKNVIDYVAGIYFFYQKDTVQSRTEFGADAGEWYVAPNAMGLSAQQRRDALNGAFVYRPTPYDDLSYAIFGQGTWHITSFLEFTGGLRYTYERKTGSYQSIQGSKVDVALNEAQQAIRDNFTPATAKFNLDQDWHHISGLATASAHLWKDGLLYATYARGAKSGGLNLTGLAQVLLDAGRGVLKPERADNIEAGLKTQWFRRRISANVTAFRTEIRNQQIPTFDVTFSPPRRYLANVATVRSQGIELELQGRPAPWLSLYGSSTFNDVKYVNYKTSPCPYEERAPGTPTVCDLSGRPSSIAPKYAVSGGGTYSVDVSENLELYLGADVSYRSTFYSASDLSRYSIIPATTLLNARVGIRDRNGRWDAQVWSTNLLDSTYWLTRSINTEDARLLGQLGDPRFFGATVRYYLN